MTTGIIYCAEFPNGKRYIGQTRRPLAERKASHKSNTSSPAFHAAIVKHGNPKWTVLARLEVEELDAAEQYFIAFYGTESPGGYNLDEGGKGGRNLSPDHRAKIAASLRGRTRAEMRRARKSKVRANNKHTPKTRAKMSLSARRRYKDPAEREKLRAANSGKKRTAQTRAKQSASAKRGWVLRRQRQTGELI